MSASKYHQYLLSELPTGSRIDFYENNEGENVKTRKMGRHPVVILPDGSILRDSKGMPIHVSLSPSDHRTKMNERARIRRALRAS